METNTTARGILCHMWIEILKSAMPELWQPRQIKQGLSKCPRCLIEPKLIEPKSIESKEDSGPKRIPTSTLNRLPSEIRMEIFEHMARHACGTKRVPAFIKAFRGEQKLYQEALHVFSQTASFQIRTKYAPADIGFETPAYRCSFPTIQRMPLPKEIYPTVLDRLASITIHIEWPGIVDLDVLFPTDKAVNVRSLVLLLHPKRCDGCFSVNKLPDYPMSFSGFPRLASLIMAWSSYSGGFRMLDLAGDALPDHVVNPIADHIDELNESLGVPGKMARVVTCTLDPRDVLEITQERWFWEARYREVLSKPKPMLLPEDQVLFDWMMERKNQVLVHGGY